ncbi:VWA domain-containing protein [Sulfurimonas sp. MAG313]|nr:VWA domain-containing protein [Sulfurimonas sp. MAG313]MDF1881132.1 VWA domain-containing protein [Sulfurimonas sp. MAG313]
MQLEFPYLLALVFVFILCAYLCKQRHESLLFPHMGLFGSASMSSSYVLKFLKWVGIISIVVAISSPYSETEIDLEPREGYDIVLLLDASGSMRARGFDENNRALNRFAVVQNIVDSFIEKRPNDNLGMIVFGEYAFVASPITYDKKILSKLLKQLYIGVAGKKTAIFDAIAQSVTLMHENEAKSKIAILLTDGQNTAGQMPYEAALSLAKREGLKIYTIGIGRPGEFDERTLSKIANDTNAKFFPAYSAEQLELIYDEINELETSELVGEKFLNKSYYYNYFLFIAFISLLLYLILKSKKGWA